MASSAADAPPAAPPQPVWHGLVAGAASGLAARVVTFPADTVKARLQVQGAAAAAGGAAAAPHYRGALDAARCMLLREGPPSLYRGFGAVLLGVLPANAAYFGGYEAAKGLVPPGWGAAGDMATGAAAQLLAGAVYTPVDIVKERMQVQAIMGGAYKYRGPLHALRSLLAEGAPGEAGGGGGGGGSGGGGGGGGGGRASRSSSGGGGGGASHSSGGGGGGAAPAAARWRFGGLFRGYWATNAVWLPWNVLYIAGYEAARQQAAHARGVAGPDALPAWDVAGCSAAAAAAAALVTHPGDVVKTRLQVLTATPQGRGLTAVAVARRMWAAEGGAVFWSGLSARLLNIAPGCALSWALYEQIKAGLADKYG
jgi:solute carrier family 25 citrate transporter 1